MACRQTGFAQLSTTDAGFYSQGYYFTFELEYAVEQYGEPFDAEGNVAVIVCNVVVGNMYPVIEAPGDPHSLNGKPAVPKYEDTRKFKMTKKVLKNSDMIKSLFLGVKEFLLAHQAQVKWPKQRPPFRAMAMLKVPNMAELLTQQRLWLSAHVLDFACNNRSLSPVRSGVVSFDDPAIAAFASIVSTGSGISSAL